MAEFQQLKTAYKIPEMLQRDIDALEEGVKNEVSYVDCLQDEVRGSAHGVTGGETFKRLHSKKNEGTPSKMEF